ncbi:SpoIID/LytB domain-containing protein [Blastococcus sp. PRF04-17]|uniref:SpoIID/LytB domain-containing protein n=1 Tax=Blastococcus sp. PRF04-17 TaxID=2933797 RepID=UPI001FF69D0F|nr:SpoIID/LytB domain-containing protein [Blastococcus sp. PRF04-17]UOY02509.1 SpoIID/LytB domain-containing protein [Blastococcus sp. PRF04-17]
MGGSRFGRRLLAAVVAAMAAASFLVVGAPAAQAAPGDVTITGHGFGHGRGLSQWGAYGYATRSGWTHQQILAHFYGNTAAGDIGNPAIIVRLIAMDNRTLAVTSGQTFTVGGRQLAAGTAGVVSRNADGSWQLSTRTSCTGTATGSVRITTPTFATLAAPGDDVRRMLTLCAPEARAYRGTLSLVWDGSALRTVNRLPMEEYLRGVVPREAPATWGDGAGINALRAQAVAARSYAQGENRTAYAKTCDTTTCQVYGGAGLNGSSLEDARTNRAVADTAGDVRTLNGQVARTEFSSSSGGWTAGGTFPAVVDAGDVVSPYHNWSTTVTRAQISAAFGVGTLQAIQVLSRNGLGADGGRVLTVRVTGSTRAVTVSGLEFRTALGLRSDWFSVGPVVDPTQSDISPVHVAAARTNLGTVVAFVRGTNGSIYASTGTATAFSPWQRIPFTASTGPSAVSWDGRRIEVFAVGTDRHLYHTSTVVDSNGRPTTFAPWDYVGGTFTTAVTVASLGNRRLLIAGRGTNGQVYVRSFDNSGWSAFRSAGGQAVSAPAVDVLADGTYRVSVVGTDGVVWTRAVSGTGATPLGAWTSTGRPSGFAPGASATTWWAANVRALAVSNGQSVREVWGDGRVVDVGGTATSAVALTEQGTGEVWAFVRGRDNALWVNITDGATSTWRSAGGLLG